MVDEERAHLEGASTCPEHRVSCSTGTAAAWSGFVMCYGGGPAARSELTLGGRPGHKPEQSKQVSGKGLKCHGPYARVALLHKGCVLLKLVWGARSGSERCEVFTGGIEHPVLLLWEGGEENCLASEPGVASVLCFFTVKEGLISALAGEKVIVWKIGNLLYSLPKLPPPHQNKPEMLFQQTQQKIPAFIHGNTLLSNYIWSWFDGVKVVAANDSTLLTTCPDSVMVFITAAWMSCSSWDIVPSPHVIWAVLALTSCSLCPFVGGTPRSLQMKYPTPLRMFFQRNSCFG